MSAELQSTHLLGDIMKYRQTSPTASEATTLPCGSEAAYQDSDFDTDSDCPESPLNQTKLPPTATQGALDLVRKEGRLLVGLIKDNLNAGATPVVVMYVATASATTGATWRGTLTAAAMGLLYLTVFDLVNQWSGVTEDVINKPWRPIPKGLMTVWGCKVRCGVVAIACLAVSHIYSLMLPCVLCFSATFGYAVGWDKNFVFRGFVFMPMIFMIHFIVATRLALGPASENKALWEWAALFAAYYTVPFLLADLRDVLGDAEVGRRTLPVLLGAGRFRAMLFVLVAMLSPRAFQQMLAAVWAEQAVLAWACLLWNFMFVVAILYFLATGDSRREHILAYKLVVCMYTFGTAPCFYFIIPATLQT